MAVEQRRARKSTRLAASASPRSRRLVVALAAVLVSLVLGGCDNGRSRVVKPPRAERVTEPEAPPAPEPLDPVARVALTWTGCDISKKAYMVDAANAYRDATGIEISITGGGATRGIRATAGGSSDIGGTCRQCLPTRFPAKEGGIVLTHVAWDALVFFTHADNNVRSITREEAKNILLGKITNWSELGGDDARILLVFRRQTVRGNVSGVGYMTRRMLFGEPEIDYTRDAIFYRSSGPIEKFVEKTPYSFAVTGVSSARKRNVRILELDGVPPTASAIAAGRYALFRPLYLATRGEPQGAAKDFIDWLLGDAGQDVMRAAGTVSLDEGRELGALFAYWPSTADGCVVWNR